MSSARSASSLYSEVFQHDGGESGAFTQQRDKDVLWRYAALSGGGY